MDLYELLGYNAWTKDYEQRMQAEALASKNQEAADAAYRAQMGEQGALHLRQLMHILRGGKPSRDVAFDPAMMPARGVLAPQAPSPTIGPLQPPHVRRMPPILGVRG